MCGRFTQRWNEWRQVICALGVEDEEVTRPPDYRPRFNIAPPDQHFIIISEFERRKSHRARWDLVNRWARDGLPPGKRHENELESVPLLHRPYWGKTSTPDSSHKRAYVGGQAKDNSRAGQCINLPISKDGHYRRGRRT